MHGYRLAAPGAAWGAARQLVALSAPDGGTAAESRLCGRLRHTLPLLRHAHVPCPCIRCLQAKPENLVDTFILLMPPASKTQQDLARVCELKVGPLRWCMG